METAATKRVVVRSGITWLTCGLKTPNKDGVCRGVLLIGSATVVIAIPSKGSKSPSSALGSGAKNTFGQTLSLTLEVSKVEESVTIRSSADAIG